MQNPNPCVTEHLLPEQSWMNLTREWLRLDTAAAWRAMWGNFSSLHGGAPFLLAPQGLASPAPLDLDVP